MKILCGVLISVLGFILSMKSASEAIAPTSTGFFLLAVLCLSGLIVMVVGLRVAFRK